MLRAWKSEVQPFASEPHRLIDGEGRQRHINAQSPVFTTHITCELGVYLDVSVLVAFFKTGRCCLQICVRSAFASAPRGSDLMTMNSRRRYRYFLAQELVNY